MVTSDEEKIKKRNNLYREAGKISCLALEYGATLIKEGTSLLEVADKIEAHIMKKGGQPAFPVNIAIDSVAAHFSPRHDDEDLVFERGNIVKLDVGVHVKGFIGDNALTVEVSTRNWKDIITASREALNVAVEMIAPGVDLSKVGAAIQETIKSHGYKSVKNLTGHSLKRYNLHAGLSVPNIKEKVKGEVKVNTVLAIEPFATNGEGRVDGKRNSNIYRFLKKKFVTSLDAMSLQKYIINAYRGLPFAERWCVEHSKRPQYALSVLKRSGAITNYPVLEEIDDGMVSQAEHTVLVTEEGCEILTISKP
jgi:methionyl aminopeptidase